MPRKPNYQFERLDRERVKAAKAAEKALIKKELKEQEERKKPAVVIPSRFEAPFFIHFRVGVCFVGL